jgi:hypothetical protein
VVSSEKARDKGHKNIKRQPGKIETKKMGGIIIGIV